MSEVEEPKYVPCKRMGEGGMSGKSLHRRGSKPQEHKQSFKRRGPRVGVRGKDAESSPQGRCFVPHFHRYLDTWEFLPALRIFCVSDVNAVEWVHIGDERTLQIIIRLDLPLGSTTVSGDQDLISLTL